jgi:peptidoglycan/xylan/chitin deacetylase (PgdA/CDA1 family)
LVKTGFESLEKDLYITGDYIYTVKSRIGDFDIVYDLDNIVLIDEGRYKINIMVINTKNGDNRIDNIIWIPEMGEAGILLSFDDYYSVWNEYLYLFDNYNVSITFFVFGYYGERKAFCKTAQNKGHEIGNHTTDHKDLKTIPKNDKEQFDYQTIGLFDGYKTGGIDVTSFAYPYGSFEDWMHEELLKHYHILRGYDKYFHVYNKEKLRRGGYIASKSIDFNKYKDSEVFRADIKKMCVVIKFIGNGIIPLTTHIISSTDTGWAIRPNDLEFLLKTGNEFKLRWYRYNDFL